MGKAALGWYCPARFLTESLFELSSHGLGDEWPPLPEKERKNRAREPLEDRYGHTGGPASHVKTPPLLPALSAVFCIADGQTSGSEWAESRGCGGRACACM